MDLIQHRTDEMHKLLTQFSSTQAQELSSLARRVAALFSSGGQLLVAGGGQLQPLAQLLVSAFAFRLEFDRPSLPAVALGSDPVLNSRLLAAGLYDQFLVRHYRSLNSEEHLVLLLNDGSPSPALQLLCDEVRENDQDLALISGCGERDPLYCSDYIATLSLETEHVARQQELGLFCAHLLCELVEKDLFNI